MHVEYSITIGNLVSAAAAIGSVLIAGWKISVQLKVMQIKINMLWNWYKSEHNISDLGDKNE